MLELHGVRGLDQPIPMDVAECSQSYILICPNDAHLRLSFAAYRIVQRVFAGAAFADLAAEISQSDGVPITATDVEAAYQHIVACVVAAGRTSQKPKSLWLRLPCLPALTVERLTRPLTPLFHPLAAVTLLILAASALITVMGLSFSLTARQNLTLTVQPSTLAWAYAFLFLSLVGHELGHASACARFGARPSDIGVGIYVIYPVLYSDVTNAWQLSRQQRVVVDLAGIYFQLIVAAVYAIAYHLTSWMPLSVAIVLTLSSCAFSLNPVLKWDGYWAVADALGVTNLAQQPRRLLQHVWDCMRGCQREPLPWSRPTTIGLVIYTLVTLVFWAQVIWLLAWLLSALGDYMYTALWPTIELWIRILQHRIMLYH